MAASIHLSGGALVVCDGRPGLSTLTFCLGIPLSSRHEGDGELGAAHLLEHVAMTAPRGDGSLCVDDWVAQAGGRANAATSKEWVTYWLRVPGAHAVEAVLRLVDAVVRPQMRDEDLDREARVVAQELRAGAADAEHVATEEFFATLFAGHPLGRSVAGRSADGTFHPHDTTTLGAFHARALGTIRPVAVLVGSPENVERCVTSLQSSALSSAAALCDRPGTQPPEPESSERLKVADGEYATVVAGGLGSGRSDPLRAAHHLLSVLIGGHPGSALERRLRRDTGTSYYIESSSKNMSDSGVWRVVAGCVADDVPEVVAAVRSCLRDAAAGEIPAEMLSVARAHAAGNWQIDMEDPVELAHEYVYASFDAEGPADVLMRTQAQLAEVRAVDLARAAERVLATFTAVAAT